MPLCSNCNAKVPLGKAEAAVFAEKLICAETPSCVFGAKTASVMRIVSK